MSHHAFFSRRRRNPKQVQPNPPPPAPPEEPEPPTLVVEPQEQARSRKRICVCENRASLAIVLITWHREPELLHNSLGTLHQQTVLPAEIVLVDMNTSKKMSNKVKEVASLYPLTRIVSAPTLQFSMSWGFNVGVKRTLESSHYVMTTGMEMFFGRNVIEKVMEIADDGIAVMSPCGFLPEKVKVEGPEYAYENWDGLIRMVHPNPPRPVSGGTMFVVRRSWWFEVRGYDEVRRPFAYADSDLERRIRDYRGVTKKALQWPECQVLHPWHERSELVSKLGGIWPKPEETHIVVNPDGWGEVPIANRGELSDG